MTHQIEYAAFDEVAEAIKSRFPHLRINLTRSHPHVEALLEIPAQEGLRFDVSINLQNCDELHLNAGSLWCEWFPCRKKEVVHDFIDAVCGLLSGDFRILEHKRGNDSFKAQLQKKGAKDWVSIATWSKFYLFSWGMQKTVLQNTGGPNQTAQTPQGRSPGGCL